MWEIFPNRGDLTQFFPVVSMIALLVPEISPGVGFCDEDGRTRTEELGILVVELEKGRHHR